MQTIGNIVWIIFGGLVSALWWVFFGALFYVTVVGIPLGRQCFKFASLTLAPFGKDVAYGGGAPSLVANVVWLVVCGLGAAVGYVVLGCLYCVTVVGIPFGLQIFKLAKLSLLPFGAEVLA